MMKKEPQHMVRIVSVGLAMFELYLLDWQCSNVCLYNECLSGWIAPIGIVDVTVVTILHDGSERCRGRLRSYIRRCTTDRCTSDALGRSCSFHLHIVEKQLHQPKCFWS